MKSRRSDLVIECRLLLGNRDSNPNLLIQSQTFYR